MERGLPNLALEPNIFGNDDFLIALRKELESFLEFNHCSKLRLHKSSPANVRTELGSIEDAAVAGRVIQGFTQGSTIAGVSV